MHIPRSQIVESISGKDLIYKKTNLPYEGSNALKVKNGRIYSIEGEELISIEKTFRSKIIDNEFTRKLVTLRDLPIDHIITEDPIKYCIYNKHIFREVNYLEYDKMDKKDRLSIDYYKYKSLKITRYNIFQIKYININVYKYFYDKYFK